MNGGQILYFALYIIMAMSCNRRQTSVERLAFFRSSSIKPVPPRGVIFVFYCCHCFQQKQPNQNPLFARIFIGLTGAETKILSC